jgi:predicted DNA-binding transcriptional regulator AlpA
VTDRPPDLVALARDADPAALPSLILTLLQAQSVATARLMAERSSDDGRTAAAPDVNLSAEEAARRLGMSVDYLYKHKKLPFRRQIGRRVVFSSAGLERWNRQRQERP